MQPDATGRSVETVRVDGLPNTKAGELQAALASYDTTAHPSDPRQLLYNVRPEWKGNGRWVVTKYYRTPSQGGGGGGGGTDFAPVQFESWFAYRYSSWLDPENEIVGPIAGSRTPRPVDVPVTLVSIYAGELDETPYDKIKPFIGKVNGSDLTIYGTLFRAGTVRMVSPRVVILKLANDAFRYRTTYRMELNEREHRGGNVGGGQVRGWFREYLSDVAQERGYPTNAQEVYAYPIYESANVSFATLPFFNG